MIKEWTIVIKQLPHQFQKLRETSYVIQISFTFVRPSPVHYVRLLQLHCILMCSAYFSTNLRCSSHFKHVRNYFPLYGYSSDRIILGNSHTCFLYCYRVEVEKDENFATAYCPKFFQNDVGICLWNTLDRLLLAFWPQLLWTSYIL